MARLVPAASSSRPCGTDPGRDAGPGHESGRPVRVRHTARHARTSDLRPRSRTSLSIRSAERRRWAADLNGPGRGGLVVHGMGGIGKSTLAAQIAARIGRLQSSRVISVISGEVSAAAFADQGSGPAEADFVVLENFDDNLAQESGQWTVRDPDLAAQLGSWTGKLLITCRHPFALGTQADPIRLVFRHLGPLTRSGAAELITALPAIRLLGEAERDRAWRLAAGHPLAMEYLDRLLSRGEPFPELAARLGAAITAALGTGTDLSRAEPTELPEAAAELIAATAGELLFGELFDRLSAGARSLLARAAAVPGPVAAGALAARPGHVTECEAAGLLTIASRHELAVHRWTAGQLRRRLAEPGSPAPAASKARRLRAAGAGALAVLSVVLAAEAGRELSAPHLASAQGPLTASSAPVGSATAIRDQAAAWTARQVSRGAIVACDPAMCAALAQRGVPSGDLLVLGPGAGDPLGSDVVLGTAAVRGLFGGRLAAVYAPEVLASFGTGAARIDVRITAPGGSAAYRRALAADLRSRRTAGRELLRDPRVAASPAARAALEAGQVDARLLIALAALAASEPVRITAFGAPAPGASPGLPLRAAELTAPAAAARRMLAFLRAQRSPYQPAQAGLAGPAVTVEFAGPAPLGLLRDH